MNTIPITFTGIFGQQNASQELIINSIEIPIIQRDYAQGRETKEVNRIRKQFVKSLFNAITGVTPAIKLDFVYGNVTDGKLIPLDGQQRLTTLFLLHWYIVKHEKINKDEYIFLKNFTYKTRFSSQHFCESLVDCQPDFDQEILSEWITNQNWFMYSWENDPTIHSMLVMLDEIHNLFKNDFGLWPKLVDCTNPPISFYFLPLKDMGLTDNLYIKMNSRGKPLTDFEHFKADFEKIIKSVSLDLYNDFVKKVDNDWVDLFWNYRSRENVIDDDFMRYYRFVTEMICFQNDIEILENDYDLAVKVYGKENDEASKNLELLFNSLDCWKGVNGIDAFFDSVFSKSSYESNKVLIYSEFTNLFLQCCHDYGSFAGRNRRFSLNSTLYLYAIVQYLNHKNQVKEEEFTERIRIIRNLILNSQDEIREKRMQGLLNDTFNIIVNGQIPIKSTGYNEIQKNEELNKILWRSQNVNLVKTLNKLEDHFLLQGSVAIIGLENPEKFKLRATNFSNLFNDENSYIHISKALLTIGDYSQLVTWRFLFGNNNPSTWRELLTISNQRKRFEVTKATLLQLLDSLEDNIEEYLQEMIDTFLNESTTQKDWRYYFIKYPEMRHGNSGVYYWRRDESRIKENPYEVFMMNTSLSLNGKHWDPFLYVISRDDDFTKELTLEEYGNLLIINKTNEHIKCLNSSWEILDENNILSKSLSIKQANGIDVVDRIELLKKHLKSVIKGGN